MRPYLKSVWPRKTDIATLAIAESLGRVSIAAGSAFRQAYREIRPWLLPITYPDQLVGRIRESSICSEFPERSLDFLRNIMDEHTHCPCEDLGQCLKAIRSADPSLEGDPRFDWLVEFLLTHGGRWN